MSTISPPPPRKKRRVAGPSDSNASASAATPTTPTVPEPPPAPPENWLRIYSWNINGIQPFIQPSIGAFIKPVRPSVPRPDAPITTSLRNFLRRHHWPQIFHLQEVKINPTDESTKRAVESAVNVCKSGPDDGPRYEVRYCLPSDKYNASGFGRKIYGVATIIRSDVLPQITAVRTVDWDIEGRVLILETRSRLSIWNVYGVNGTANPYKQPDTGKPAGNRHDRKLRFHESMLQECRELEQKGWRLVIGGDLNVASRDIDGHPKLRTKPEQHIKNREDFNAKFFDPEGGLELCDSFRFLHPKRRRFTYLPRHMEWKESCDRVDYFLLSRELASVDGTVKEADVLMSEAERGPSDHVPIWVSLDVPE